MSGVPSRLREFLDENGVEYRVIHHARDFRAMDTADATRTPMQEFAKTVFIYIDGEYAMAVLPASHFLSERRLEESLEARCVRLASESHMELLCPDCDAGAAPPFGNLYGLPVFVSPALTEDEEITFNAGTHEDAIRMSYVDFARLTHPRVVHMARHE